MGLAHQAPAGDTAGVAPALRPGRVYYDHDWGRWLVSLGNGHSRTAIPAEIEAEISRRSQDHDTIRRPAISSEGESWPVQRA